MVELDEGVQFMRPTLQGTFVVGATSDHLVVDVTDAPTVKLGEKLDFVASHTAIAYSWAGNTQVAASREGLKDVSTLACHRRRSSRGSIGRMKQDSAA